MTRFLPVLIFACLAVFAGFALLRPAPAPFPLRGQPPPAFSLPAALPGGRGVSDADLLRDAPVLVNFFASWCVSCRAEQGALAAAAVPVYGIAYRDDAAALEKLLAEEGNPFAAVGSDPEGEAAVAFGVGGVPETFVVGADGRLLYRHAGPVTPEIYDAVLRPLLEGGKT